MRLNDGTTELQILLSIEGRLTAIEYRLANLEKPKPSFDVGAFFKSVWGRGLIILLLIFAQVPAKDALLAVLK